MCVNSGVANIFYFVCAGASNNNNNNDSLLEKESKFHGTPYELAERLGTADSMVIIFFFR